jgi:hypothetical protein
LGDRAIVGIIDHENCVLTRSQELFLLSYFALVLGWDLWEALGNLVGLEPFYEAMGIGASVPWLLLWAGALLPLAAFGIAVVLWRKWPGVPERLAIMVVAWAVVAGMSLSLAALEQAWRAAALQAVAG